MKTGSNLIMEEFNNGFYKYLALQLSALGKRTVDKFCSLYYISPGHVSDINLKYREYYSKLCMCMIPNERKRFHTCNTAGYAHSYTFIE